MNQRVKHIILLILAMWVAILPSVAVASVAPTHRFYLRDYLGSTAAVIDGDGNVLQSTAYFPSGLPLTPNNLAPQTIRLHTGKDYFGLQDAGWYDNQARYYDCIIGRFTTQDPLAETTPWNSPYVHCENNPLLYTDPSGLSTYVTINSDSTYSVIGGKLDNDKNIYLFTDGEKGNSIGVTTSITSFYHSEEEKWAIGSIIDPNDNSGNVFISNMMSNTPPLVEYMLNARTKEKYDFKYSNGTTETNDDKQNIYRGMPVPILGDNIYTSARDVGNMVAGYVAATNCIPWEATRIAFDLYQSKTSGKFVSEGISTQNAEYYGWNLGNNTSSSLKAINLFKSFIHLKMIIP